MRHYKEAKRKLVEICKNKDRVLVIHYSLFM